ncbi:MAG: hypothetical protein IBX71_03320 [Candidatus Desulforudis sp.]|nr:hypothetical protein [Desulforudis sp.]
MEAYVRLGSAILREVVRDIRGGPRGENKIYYVSAVGFLRTPLFEMICESQGVNPSLTKRGILQLSSTKEVPAIRTRAHWKRKRKHKQKRVFHWAISPGKKMVN